MATRFLPLLLVACLLAAVTRAAPPAEPGVPRNSGIQPGIQTEADWNDNRWMRTDVGPFLSSVLPLPNSTLAKGLTIRLRNQESLEGAAAYDTATGALMACWTHGFLVFAPARFGLIQAPRPATPPIFPGPTGPAWSGATYHYEGLRLGNTHVVLDASLDGHAFQEYTTLEGSSNAPIFTRILSLPAHATEWTLALLETPQSSPTLHTDGTAEAPNEKATVHVKLHTPNPASGPHLATNAHRLLLRLPPSQQPLTLSLSLSSTPLPPPGPTPVPPALASSPASTPRWLPELKLPGTKGLETDFLAVDTLPLPHANPWNALLFLSGVAFTPDGHTAFVCSIHGDVWRVSGLSADLRNLSWKRFATGLHQPLGLRTRGSSVLVLGRDQITELTDENGDGEADHYRNFCNLVETSTGAHDYVTCLEEDEAGNLYYVDPRGLHRVSKDGRSMQTIATGWRNPNGLGVGPGPLITVMPQQGNWTPSSAIVEARPGAYYGFPGPKTTPQRPEGFDPPLCWIPHDIDNSSGSEVWLPDNVMKPLGGHFLHLVWGRCTAMLLLRDASGDTSQGAVVPLPARFLSGPMRGTVHPDGSVYLAGSTGWQTSATQDGCLQRLRRTGRDAFLPIAFHVQTNGIRVTFSQPLDPATATDPGSYSVRAWNYKYAAAYGSKDWSPTNPNREGRDTLDVRSVQLGSDGQTLFLDLGNVQPVMQMEIQYNLTTAQGRSRRSQFWLTVNRPLP